MIPKNDSKMLVYLMTLAKDCQSITKTLSLVRTHLSFEQNINKLSGCVKEELQKTLAFLLGSAEEDTRVTKYKVDRLRLAVVFSLLKLMPRYCWGCSENTPYAMAIGQSPEVLERGG